MELLNTNLLGAPLTLEASLSGFQQLYWNNHLVSQKTASEVANISPDEPCVHTFQLKRDEQAIDIVISINISWQPFSFDYKITVAGQVVEEGSRNQKDLETHTPTTAVPIKKSVGFVGLASLGLKLFKSAKVIKVVLAGASLAAYSWFFSLKFALALLLCLVFHEYGHIRAMKYFGMKTKGIYLIPFLGGLALSDEKINTRWQDVAISMMGPFFGLIMSLVCLLLFWVTDEVMFAGLAAFNALLNLFNLLPILPLDGGHVLKSISFSMNSITGLALCALGALLGVVISYQLNLALLGFLLMIGSVEILIEWRMRHQSLLLPMDAYGRTFSTLWYLLTVGGLVAVIWYLAGTGDAMLGLPLKVLQS